MTIPPQLQKSDFNTLPEGSGVYFFYGPEDELLYVGKSINIKKRVKSHFARPGQSTKHTKLFVQTARIDTKETAGELGALLLELEYIKNRQPLFNKRSRKKKKLVVAYEEQVDGFSYPDLTRVSSIEKRATSSILGVFKSRRQAKSVIEKLAKEYELCRQRLQFSGKQSRGPCFYYQLDRCRGACVGKESATGYNERFRQAFEKRKMKAWPFDGPVEIHETHGEREDVFLVDQWCLLEAYVIEAGKQCNFFDDISSTDSFNYDAYKVLARFLLSDSKQETEITVLC